MMTAYEQAHMERAVIALERIAEALEGLRKEITKNNNKEAPNE